MTGVLTVGDLTRHIGNLFTADRLLSDVTVVGEISNFKHHGSGHMYFTLKDQESVIRCAMFRSANSRLRFRPEDGMRVQAHGAVSIYGPAGAYQLYPDRMEPDGLGSLYLAYEQRKLKLQNEGLFKPERKRPLPFLPRRIGVVTSPTGAVIRDICHVLYRRFPSASLLLSPAAVQGADAAERLISAMQRLQKIEDVDVILLARGGGSLEDLWPFNDENLARAIAACRVPVISAVGHETDYTISDFVADLRAPTPSAAAELVMPDLRDLHATIAQAQYRNTYAMRHCLAAARNRMVQMESRPIFKSPLRMLEIRHQQLDGLQQRLSRAASGELERSRLRIARIAGKLDALSPLRVLGRGYAAVLDKEGGLVRSARMLRKGETIRLRFHDGAVRAEIITDACEEENGKDGRNE